MFWDVSKQTAEITVTSYASGSWGCGAFWRSNWFHFPWPSSLQDLPITIKELVPIVVTLPITTKELVPIVVAAAVFSPQWRGHLAKFKVDKMAVVHVFNNAYSKDQHLMHLIHTLVFLAFHFEFWFQGKG